MPENLFESGHLFREEIDRKLLRAFAVAPEHANTLEKYKALSLFAREQLAQRWVKTQQEDREKKARRICYLSMEFLLGRSLNNALDALDLRDRAEAAFPSEKGVSLSGLLESETDAALGNGGLGRLAACFLDSMATLELPSWGYGMHYEYGMFSQAIVNGEQVEHPDLWLAEGSSWIFPRPGRNFIVNFGGVAEHHGEWSEWNATESVVANAYDYVIPGHGTGRVSTLRLWKASAPAQIDLNAFNSGDYARAAEIKNRFENISWVLYPNDSTPAGRELRLRQEYFFVSASIQDILRNHLEEHGNLNNLHEQIAIHLNDTHPAIAIAELMRLLCDVHGMLWADAWSQCRRIFSYTNHTLMPEALETWPVSLMIHLLPRHMRIIFQINQEFLNEVTQRFPGDVELVRRVSLIDDADGNEHNKRIRMSHLCIVGSHRVNGVSRLHSDLMVKTIFADFARLYPERFHNKTNGVTPRRWLAQANRGLAGLIDSRIGRDWRYDLDRLEKLKEYSGDPEFRRAFAEIKRENKQRLADYIHEKTGIAFSADSLFDVQVKRIHEYKRQLLNVLHVITRYNAILHGLADDAPPRCVIFAGKAASSYVMAKLIIRLIHDVAQVINNDRRIHDRLKVIFVPNYSVSIAELIMPAADLSEQISMAGTEASGTGNMKFSLNGALTIGTEDGANIEIRDGVGPENIFIFGNSAARLQELRRSGYDPRGIYTNTPALNEALNRIDGGFFSPGDSRRYHSVFNSLVNYGDHYMLLADYSDYIEAQKKADQLFLDSSEWHRKAILNVAGMGIFSSDRAIREYAVDTWKMASSLRKTGDAE
ncbi:MAG: glycogen/starch/alpha-glucan phosphorylase [Candidatus Accumulibacter sp.]|jgi:starch phosphorylase|nr:glycogen/starch/alpha-glucan phosphorylase [Accumulibacter sp.]